MCNRELIPSPPIIRIKRGIEQLKLYQLSDNHLPAEVSFTIYENGRKWFYGIYGFTPNYTISKNFEGGCSQSVETIPNLDLDNLFSYIEKLDLSKSSEIQFNPPTRLLSEFELFLQNNFKRF